MFHVSAVIFDLPSEKKQEHGDQNRPTHQFCLLTSNSINTKSTGTLQRLAKYPRWPMNQMLIVLGKLLWYPCDQEGLTNTITREGREQLK